MEHRQRIEYPVRRIEIHDRPQLRAIRQQRAMAVHDALRRPLRPRREQHQRGRTGIHSRPRQPFRMTNHQHPAQLVQQADRIAHILQINETNFCADRLHQPIEFPLLHGAAGRQDGFDPGGGTAGQHRVRAGGEIHHRRHPPLGLQREEGHHRAHRIRQHHPDMFAGTGERRQFPPQHHAAKDQPADNRFPSNCRHRFRSEQYPRAPAGPGRTAAEPPTMRRTDCVAGVPGGTRHPP